MTLVEREIAFIKKDEGFSGTPYYDTKNVLSIGWGHNLQDEPLPAMFQEFLDRHGYITEAMAEALLAKDLRDAEADCCKLFSNWPRIPVEIQGPLLNMAFNMGYDRFHSFEKLDACAEAGDWEGVAREMEDSKWYRKDVPKRARRLVARVRNYIEKKKEKGT